MRAIDGGAGRRPVSRVAVGPLPPPSTAVAEVETFEAPAHLSAEVREVWQQQAPHAFQARTLTPATALSFERYCQSVVWERAEAASSARGGSNHRGLLRQINAYELQFLLTPCGKAIYTPEAASQAPPANPLSRFMKRSS